MNNDVYGNTELHQTEPDIVGYIVRCGTVTVSTLLR